MSHFATILISLEDAPVPIERIIRIPADFTLDFVHLFIQRAMGWEDAHLYQFNTPLGIIDCEQEREELSESLFDHEVTLREVLPEVGACIHYEYDLGDSWVHMIQLLEYSDADAGDTALLSATGRCPPEDSGGVGGYEYILHVLDEKLDPNELADLHEWLGCKTWDATDPQIATLEEGFQNLIQAIYKNAGIAPPSSAINNDIPAEDYDIPDTVYQFLARPYDSPEFLEIEIPDIPPKVPILHILEPVFEALRAGPIDRAPLLERETTPDDIGVADLDYQVHALGILECTDIVEIHDDQLALTARGRKLLEPKHRAELLLALVRSGLGAYNWARFGGHSDIPAIQFTFPLVFWKLSQSEEWTQITYFTDYLGELIPDIYFECQSPFMGPISELRDTWILRMQAISELFGLVELRGIDETVHADIRPGPHANLFHWHL
ncbi:plasmid pRiA4b ORF-3 family protein [Aliidiomarina halalkaliphila]|uniref:plasmid pRiA4b ORF-3 family protein n=1 Tax=Aliidiomarina halalkaliphila TaxID=2593535 RepID=UPI00163D9528|nr:plasmid pRiA4b ORF-3 family protein [Aliidiomarina halalkaliphila]